MPHQTSLSEFVSCQAPIGILQIGLDGGITHANPAFCQLIGYTETQLRRLDNRAISHPEDFATEVRVIQQMLDHGQPQQGLRKRYRRWDDVFIWAEVKLALINDAETGDESILSFVTDITGHYLIEQEVQQYREHAALLADLAMQIRATFDLQTVLQTTVERLQDTLAVERVLVYQFSPGSSGKCIVEAVTGGYLAMQGQSFLPECMPPLYLEAYRNGRLWTVTDILDTNLTDCHKQMLSQFSIRSMMATAIVSMDATLELQKRPLWGLLVAHCHTVRTWTASEQGLLRLIATQLGTAIEQTQLLESLQQRAHELEDRVSERTQSLAKALKFEQLVHQLTETLRQHLDASQVLQAAVDGLVQTLNIDRCFASLIDLNRGCLMTHYESVRESITAPVSFKGQACLLKGLPIACSHQSIPAPDLAPLFSDDPFYQCHAECLFAYADAATTEVTQVYPANCGAFSPIRDDQGLLGMLTVCCSHVRIFEPDEMTLIKQVASQCAIALRQSDLHTQKHGLRVSADYFRSFLETSTDVFVEYDSNLRCLSMNPAGSTLLALAPEAIVGKTNQALFGVAAERLDLTIQRAFDTGEKIFVDHELSLAQGNRIFETVYTPITTPSGTVQRVIGVSRDVTELKQQWQLLETQNQQLTENTRVKQEFIATTSHELRTPLTAVLGFSNVLLQGFFGELNPKQTDYVERIHESGQHLLDLINDILDLSRLEANRLELDLQAIFVPDVCEGVIGLIRERALNQGLKLAIDLDPNVDWIVADPRRLKQMLLNLLANAVKFTEEGTIGLKVYRQPLPLCATTPPEAELIEPLPPCSERLSEMIRFLVWDTGIGIDPASQQQLFSPFSQIDSSLARQHQGTGLGLVITRKLAELHGGTVTLESSSNQGARFTVALPFRPTV